MIIQLRKYIQGTGLRILVLVIVGLFLIAGLLPWLSRFTERSNDWVVKVNGKNVGIRKYIYYTSKIEEQIREIRSKNPGFAELILQYQGLSQGPEKVALQLVTRNALLDTVAQKLQIEPPEEVVIRSFANIDPTTINLLLRHYRMRMDDLKDIVKDDTESSMMRTIIAGGSYVPEFEVKYQYAIDYLGKSFSILKFPLDFYIKKEEQKQLEQKQVSDYYTKNKQKYTVPEKRGGVKWTFNPAGYGITISDDMVQQYYEKYKGKYVDQPVRIQVRRILIKKDDPAAREKIQKIHQELQENPERFQALAKEESQDEESKSTGGIIPEFSRGQRDRTFEKTAFLLKKPNDISDIITTNDGFEILQLKERKAKTYKAFESVKNEVKDMLTKQEFNKQFTRDVKEIIKQRKADEGKLQEFIKTKGGQKETIALTGRAQDPEVQKLFSVKLNEYAVNQKDRSSIVQVTQVDQKYVPSLESIKDQVTKDLITKKAKEQLAADLKKAEQTGKKITELQKDFEGSVIESTGMIKQNDEKIKDLQARGLPVKKMFQLSTVGGAIQYAADGDGFVIQLDSIEPFDQAVFEEKKGDIIKQIGQSLHMMTMEGFVASLYRNAKIKVNKALIKH